jgi:SWI/SNF-related matrix-associated actin-dependent regulator of chromatin subfamily A protein 2/4
LSDPFLKLPTRRELPDYYEVIKRPVDINKMLTKIDDGKVRRGFQHIHNMLYIFD